MIYKQIVGISTGLPCGCEIANLYLDVLDSYTSSALGDHLLVYQRYIDDILIIVDKLFPLLKVLEILNSWHPGEIVVTTDSEQNGESTAFLDIARML